MEQNKRNLGLSISLDETARKIFVVEICLITTERVYATKQHLRNLFKYIFHKKKDGNRQG